MKDILYAVIVLFLVGFTMLTVRECAAGEWFPEASIFADVTKDSEDIYCYGRNNHASHVGAKLGLYREGPHLIRGMWVHNSCVEEQNDKDNRDVIGIGYEYKLW